MFDFYTPKHLAGPEFAPLIGLLSDVLVTDTALTAHWGYSRNHLSNLRKAGKGIPFVKLPTGGVRYRMSEILSAELDGTDGPLTLDRIAIAIATCKTVPAEHRAALIEHLKVAFAMPR